MCLIQYLCKCFEFLQHKSQSIILDTFLDLEKGHSMLQPSDHQMFKIMPNWVTERRIEQQQPQQKQERDAFLNIKNKWMISRILFCLDNDCACLVILKQSQKKPRSVKGHNSVNCDLLLLWNDKDSL